MSDSMDVADNLNGRHMMAVGGEGLLDNAHNNKDVDKVQGDKEVYHMKEVVVHNWDENREDMDLFVFDCCSQLLNSTMWFPSCLLRLC